MRLSIINRLRICWEVLTEKELHEKSLPVFQRGYAAGVYDEKLLNGVREMKNETITDGYCAKNIKDEFTDESAVDFLKELSENPSKGEYNHIPDAGEKVVE